MTTPRLPILALLVALAGCSQGDTSSPSASPSGAPAASGDGAVAPLPADKNIEDGIQHGPGPYDGPKLKAPPGGPMAGGPGGPGGPPGGKDGLTQLTDWIRGAYVTVTPGEPPAFDDALRDKGKAIYGKLCVSCHGEAGDGKGPEAEKLDPKPRDFTTGVYKLRSTPSGALPTSTDLFLSITRGLHGSSMVPFVSIPESDRWALVAYLESLSERFAKTKRKAPIEVPEPPQETEELVAKGKSAFVERGCADCHGAEGKGDGKRAADLKDAAGNPAKVRTLTEGRFRRGATMAELYLTIRTGFDGSPMAASEAIADEQTWALAAWIRSIVNDPVHQQDNPPVHPQERLGLRTSMRTLMSYR